MKNITLFNQLTTILEFLRKLNENSGGKIEESKFFSEQKNNLYDMQEMQLKFNKNLERIDTINYSNPEEVDSVLLEFHKYLNNLEWHISEISDLNAKFFKEYEDRLKN